MFSLLIRPYSIISCGYRPDKFKKMSPKQMQRLSITHEEEFHHLIRHLSPTTQDLHHDTNNNNNKVIWSQQCNGAFCTHVNGEWQNLNPETITKKLSQLIQICGMNHSTKFCTNPIHPRKLLSKLVKYNVNFYIHIC